MTTTRILGKRALPAAVILSGILIAASIWVAEAFLHVYAFKDGTVLEQVISPGTRDMLRRSLAGALVILFSISTALVLQALRRAESKLRKSEAIHAALVKHARDGIVLVQDGKFIFANEATEEISGYPVGDIIGKSFVSVLAPESRDLVAERYRLRMAGADVPNRYQVKIRCKDGKIKVAELSASVVDWGGKPADLVIVRDMTDRNEVERVLQENERKYRLLFDGIPNPVFVFDAETHRFLDCNKAVLRVYGYTKEEILSMTPFDLHPPEDIPSVERNIPCCNLDRPFRYTHLAKNGERMKVEIYTNEVDYRGRSAWMSIVRDVTEQVRAQEEILKLKEFNDELIQNTLEGISVVNADGLFSFVNPGMARTLGYAPEELIGKPWTVVIPPDQQPTVEAADERRKRGETDRYELEMVSKDGTRIPVLVSGSPHFEDGRFAGTMGVFTDVTRIKKAQAALRESEDKFKMLAEHSPSMIFINQRGRIVYANRMCEEVMGYAREELYSPEFDFRTLVADESREMVERNFKSHSAGDEVAPYEYTLVTKTGRKLDAVLTTALIPYGGDDAILGTVTDVTELKRAHRELAAEKEQLAVTLRSIGDGVITTDMGGRIVLLNKMAEKLTGWEQSEARGRLLSEVFKLIDGKTKQPLEDPLRSIIDDGSMIELTERTTLVRRDGSERLVADSGAPIFGSDSEIVGAVLVFRDVTEKVKLEEEIRRTRRLESIGTLAGGIAHDFNNLLTAVLGNISLAKMFTSPGEKLFDRLTLAERATSRARDLTQQLLTFSKGGKPIVKTLSLVPIIRDSADFGLRGSNVKAEVSLAENLLPVKADEGQIGQVISNLVINASQAMPEGGVIRIRAANREVARGSNLPLEPGNYVEVTVEDTGVGIPKQHLSRIFDPYFTTKQEGSGLGLATAHSIITKHGGYIAVESTIGQGTKFTFYVPASDESPPTEHDSPAARQNGLRGGMALVMDDDETVRGVLGDMLEYFGYEAEFAGDGTEAVKAYSEAFSAGRGFDVVIMDLTIPGGMGGKETIRKLIEIDPEVRAIVSSGYSNDPVMAEYEQHGFKACVAKPYRVDELETVLKSIEQETSRRTVESGSEA